AEVIKAGETETGCTIHIVDEGVDTGPIVLQKKCAVEPADTPATLKQKVQKLEGEAFIEVIKTYVYRNS
ncbi:MAG: formyltransferase family protein, partial [Candidatus Komeilibacteria bacterium]|nr:formyltransferase family protein [Candidatus Komeilibacteria bacterium]